MKIIKLKKKNELIVKINKNPKMENKSFGPLKLG
tara:strand:- start:151 stop:252 length:102 start_codon:yes stop_codon:yes gene_type:complete